MIEYVESVLKELSGNCVEKGEIYLPKFETSVINAISKIALDYGYFVENTRINTSNGDTTVFLVKVN